jgi:hypothetical protein
MSRAIGIAGAILVARHFTRVSVDTVVAWVNGLSESHPMARSAFTAGDLQLRVFETELADHRSSWLFIGHDG